ncbi:MAG TPA: transposase [Kofleriaceae bacterium]|nr:transposase [Kofleriaceae bacterium]
MAKRSRGRRSKGVRPSEPEQLPLFTQPADPRRGTDRKRRRGKKPGPKPKARAGSRHKVRPELKARNPVHVVLRVVSAVGNLRRRATYKAVREATLTTARREDFRIVHLSIQRNHLHLLVEADHKGALASGMQGFQISAAKHLNAAISKDQPGPRRRGAVFPDRYHAEIITTPTQARHTLNYILNNWRNHREDRVAMAQNWKTDPFSTAILFPGWEEYGDQAFLWRGPPTYDPLVVYRPRTWLLREGYLRGGPPISVREVPSTPRQSSAEKPS